MAEKHHYVPIWYQKRFIAPGEHELKYLRLFRSKYVRPDGTFIWTETNLRHIGAVR